MQEAPGQTNALGLVRYAHDYFDASRLVDNHYCKKDGYELVSPMPALFLMGQAIELAFKAYLLHKGVSLEDLRSRRYGHNLQSCRRESRERGLDELLESNEWEDGAVDSLNELYWKKRLNYIETGPVGIPAYGHLESFCKKLIHAVSGEVVYTQFNR
ncbi:MAG: hypothetical protein REI09_05265 [Candidatus Dactylopiibacterium sp.]|nr:hypothetical protein [Candidatus Dactylopiibacterium sp.]